MNFYSRVLTIFCTVILTAASFGQVKLTGAGSTFDYPLFSKWFDVYYKKTGVQINYSSIGSGGGIQQVSEGTVDFGASDAPLTEAQMNTFKSKRGSDVIHLPIIIGGVAITYNLPSVGQGLKLDGETLADIYLGKITKWNDSRIQNINQGRNLPNKAILVTHRSEGSGTSFIFTSYLSKVSPEWEKKVGNSTAVNWPVGLGGKGSEGVSGLISQTEGSIGYVELAYAVQNKLPYADIKNKDGKFISPNFNSVTASAAGAVRNMPKDLRAVITNADGKDSYPISGFSWVVLPTDVKDQSKAEALVKFFEWGISEGQSYAQGLYYSPLPKQITKLDLEKLHSVTSNWKKVRDK